METKYSWKIGAQKAIVSSLVWGLPVVIAILMATNKDLFEKPLIDVVTEYLRPILGSLSLGGLLTMAANYVKVNYSRK